MARRAQGTTRAVDRQAPKTAPLGDVPEMDAQLVPKVEELEKGTSFDWLSPSFGLSPWGMLFDDEGLVVTPSERIWAAQVDEMLQRGGAPASIDKALRLPIRRATASIETPEKDNGEAEFVRDVLYSFGQTEGMVPNITTVVAQMTYAIAVKRTYHELVFEKRPDNRFGYKKVAWRPPSSCELIRDRKTGDIRGFRQYVDPQTLADMQRGIDPRDIPVGSSDAEDEGYIRVPAARALIYVHGQDRDPINGMSDLAVTHWAYIMQQKIMLMWLTFLDGASLPKIIAYGDSPADANMNAKSIASIRGSGVLGMKRNVNNPEVKMWELIEHSGKGADQFEAAIRYLEQQMSHSVLAGFLDLTSNAGRGIGSYALSADSSGLFLSSRQSVASEIADAVTSQLIAPLVRINFGPKAAVPRMTFEKMSQEQTDKAIQLLQQLGSANSIHVPEGFLDLLVERVAQSLDLPAEKVEKLLAAKEQQMADQQAQMQNAAQAGQPAPLGPDGQPMQPQQPVPQDGTGFNQQMNNRVNAAQELLSQHRKEAQ